MRSKLLLFILFFIPIITYAQIGIGTTTPNSNLEIGGHDPNNPTSNTGILIPRVNRLTTDTILEDGLFVFVKKTYSDTVKGITYAKGFYYWDLTNKTWKRTIVGKTEELKTQAQAIIQFGNVGTSTPSMPSYIQSTNFLTTPNTGTNVGDTSNGIFIVAGSGNFSQIHVYFQNPINSNYLILANVQSTSSAAGTNQQIDYDNDVTILTGAKDANGFDINLYTQTANTNSIIINVVVYTVL